MRGQVHIGRARVDFERFIATVDGTQSLTHKECAVLRLLAGARRQGGQPR